MTAAEKLENLEPEPDGYIRKVIPFPLVPGDQTRETMIYDADTFQMGLYWPQEETPTQIAEGKRSIPITVSPSETDDLSYVILLEQEVIEPEAPAYGVHHQRRRYKSGFPKWEWNHDFGVK